MGAMKEVFMELMEMKALGIDITNRLTVLSQTEYSMARQYAAGMTDERWREETEGLYENQTHPVHGEHKREDGEE